MHPNDSGLAINGQYELPSWQNLIVVNNLSSEQTKHTAFATISVLCWTSAVASKSTHAHFSLLVCSEMYGIPVLWYLKASIQVFPPSTDTSTLSMPRPPPDAAYPVIFTCTMYVVKGLSNKSLRGQSPPPQLLWQHINGLESDQEIKGKESYPNKKIHIIWQERLEGGCNAMNGRKELHNHSGHFMTKQNNMKIPAYSNDWGDFDHWHAWCNRTGWIGANNWDICACHNPK